MVTVFGSPRARCTESTFVWWLNASVQDGEGDAALVRVVSAQSRPPYGVSSYRKGSNQYIGSAWGKYPPDLWLTGYDYLWTIQE